MKRTCPFTGNTWLSRHWSCTTCHRVFWDPTWLEWQHAMTSGYSPYSGRYGPRGYWHCNICWDTWEMEQAAAAQAAAWMFQMHYLTSLPANSEVARRIQRSQDPTGGGSFVVVPPPIYLYFQESEEGVRTNSCVLHIPGIHSPPAGATASSSSAAPTAQPDVATAAWSSRSSSSSGTSCIYDDFSDWTNGSSTDTTAGL